jgi:hypothetical protein
MGSGVMLIKSFVADYCNKSNRHQEKTMPETVFCFIHIKQKRTHNVSHRENIKEVF